jgi:hypothetical protein
MSGRISEQTEKMREMAQTTLDKAKEAVSKYMVESQKLREKADTSVRATYSTAKEMNEKAVAFAETKFRAGSNLQSVFCRRRTLKRWAPSIKII